MIKKENVQKLDLEATIDNLDTVLEFITSKLEELDCDMKIQLQLEMAVEELFVNIAHYAYTPGTGSATIIREVVDDPLSIIITFIDSGKPYDPLSREDPDTDHIRNEEIGGLGIFMVKKTMDEITYEYKDGQNILSIQKNL